MLKGVRDRKVLGSLLVNLTNTCMRRIFVFFVVLFALSWNVVCVSAEDMCGGGVCFEDVNGSMVSSGSSMMSSSSVQGAFSGSLPSERTAESMGMVGAGGVTTRRNGFIVPGDVNQDPESPIGEPWVLLVFAGIACVVIVVRQKRNKILESK